MQLSNHFSLEEMIASNEGSRRGIDNTPPPEIISNLRSTATQMEKVRDFFRHPILVNSGYRCPELNAAVNGAHDSAHMRGYAVDFIVPTFGSPLEVARRFLQSGIPFDQLIREYGWVHLSFAPSTRGSVLTKRSKDEDYQTGLVS